MWRGVGRLNTTGVVLLYAGVGQEFGGILVNPGRKGGRAWHGGLKGLTESCHTWEYPTGLVVNPGGHDIIGRLGREMNGARPTVDLAGISMSVSHFSLPETFT